MIFVLNFPDVIDNRLVQHTEIIWNSRDYILFEIHFAQISNHNLNILVDVRESYNLCIWFKNHAIILAKHDRKVEKHKKRSCSQGLISFGTKRWRSFLWPTRNCFRGCINNTDTPPFLLIRIILSAVFTNTYMFLFYFIFSLHSFYHVCLSLFVLIKITYFSALYKWMNAYLHTFLKQNITKFTKWGSKLNIKTTMHFNQLCT